MGEVAAPRGVEIGKQREAFRAFMTARHLPPPNGPAPPAWRRVRYWDF